MTRESEKSKLFEIVERKRAAGEEIISGESEHFLVIYRGGREIYSKFGSWLDTHPSVASFLEIKSKGIWNG